MQSSQVLLFYKYIQIEDPEEVANWQRAISQKLGLKGRIIVAHEGINATVEGSVEATTIYEAEMVKDKRFADIHFKRSPGTGDSFPKLTVKVRPEIVSAHLKDQDINPIHVTGKYLQPSELHDWFESGREFYIVDMRNDYEQKVGYFDNSIRSQFGNFRDLPQILETLAPLKDKPIVTVCTGGVRCEKASGFLMEHGFSDVYQLAGGIVSYMEAYPNQHFLGKLYVFDQRIVMGFNIDSPAHVIVGRCALCGSVSENYINCRNDRCHLHFMCCQQCVEQGDGFCSADCRAAWTEASTARTD